MEKSDFAIWKSDFSICKMIFYKNITCTKIYTGNKTTNEN